MKVFNYSGILGGKKINGELLAKTIEDAKIILSSKSIKSLKIKAKFFNFDFSSALSNKEMISFFSAVSAMDMVGIDILKSMKLMKDEIAMTKKLKKICQKIFDFINEGDSFSLSCQKASKSFTDDLVGLISIAESTGRFSFVFDKIVDYIKWSFDIEQRTKKAIKGPMMTLLLMVTMIIVMSVTTLPKIMEFLEYFNMAPPPQTVALIAFSTFIRDYWYWIIGSLFSFWIFTKIFSRIFSPFAIYIGRIKLAIPVFGELMIKLDTSRFISFFQLMYDAGAEMLNILDNVSNIVKNKYIASRIEMIHKNVINGDTVFKALDEQIIFPIMFRKMMAICEATGEVGPVLQNVKYFFDKETNDTVDKLVGTIKPTMTIFLGGMLIWMGSAMLGPIYANIGKMSG